jgi:hypothetical protein
MRHGYKNEGKGAVETDGCFKQPHSRPLLWSNKRLFASLKYSVMISRSYDNVTKFRETLISGRIYII